MKTCPKCHLSEPQVFFGIARNRYEGKTPYCRTCWTLYVQEGRWAKGTKRMLPLWERLWEGVQICAHGLDCPFCCWPWTKLYDQDGYGKFALTTAVGKPRTVRATHILWEVWHARPLPVGRLVRHYCDVPGCVNPSHFWIRTLADLVRKGEIHPHAKLTEADVLEIRACYVAHTPGKTVEALATRFHVSKFAILCILHRKTWKHI